MAQYLPRTECPLTGLLLPELASSWFYVWQFAGIFMICSIVSAAFGVANRCIFNATLKSHLHWGTPSLFMLFPLFLISTPASVNCLCWKWKLSLFAAFLHLRPFNLLLLQSITLKVQQFLFPSWGKNLCICFSYTKETHFMCVWVCVALEFALKYESDLDSNLYHFYFNFLFTNSEIISSYWIVIMAWSSS